MRTKISLSLITVLLITLTTVFLLKVNKFKK